MADLGPLVSLPADLPDQMVDLAHNQLDPASTSSLYHDLVAGRRLELDALLGDIARRAEKHGTDVATTRAMLGVLEPWAARVDSGRG